MSAALAWVECFLILCITSCNQDCTNAFIWEELLISTNIGNHTKNWYLLLMWFNQDFGHPHRDEKSGFTSFISTDDLQINMMPGLVSVEQLQVCGLGLLEEAIVNLLSVILNPCTIATSYMVSKWISLFVENSLHLPIFTVCPCPFELRHDIQFGYG